MTFAKRKIGQTGVSVTEFGVGGGPFGNLMAPMTDAETRDTLGAAWNAGFRYFDTARSMALVSARGGSAKLSAASPATRR